MKRYFDLDPDEVFLDSSNLPSFDTQQFEGNLERPISRRAFYTLSASFVVIGLVFLFSLGNLQIKRGEAFALRADNNTLRHTPIFAPRGVIYDRLGKELAWNIPERHYIEQPGFGHLLGYLGYPKEDELANNDLYSEELVGRDGAEAIFQKTLQGERGIKIEEIDVAGKIQTNYLLESPVSGKDITLAVDARIQEKLYQAIAHQVDEGRAQAGAGVLMDIATGEVLALVSVPEYDPNALTVGPQRSSEAVQNYLHNKSQPFLNRAVAGLYAPGSIVKPIMALAALTENVISPEKKILSTGALTLPNPYDPEHPSIFRDWKAHGWVDMRRALAVSSDVYFYEIGGGFEDQKGLGISKIDKYAGMFGLGKTTGIELGKEGEGTVPTPEWKAATFNGDPWRIGNTYHTAIGQYGFQVTPIQMVRVAAAIANNGHLVTPTIVANEGNTVAPSESLPIKPEHFQIVRDGMRMAVTEGGAQGLNFPDLEVAAKTGTAELGTAKKYVNSWVEGFFPYQQPRYAFAVVLERGSLDNLVGSVYVMREVLDWIKTYAPEYAAVS
jgi:penicillin-binding protein 2